MKNEKTGLMTSGNIAKTLGVSGAKVKKAIKDLKIKPEAKKGVCNYYSVSALGKIKTALR
jgi:biotin operon repressor